MRLPKILQSRTTQSPKVETTTTRPGSTSISTIQMTRRNLKTLSWSTLKDLNSIALTTTLAVLHGAGSTHTIILHLLQMSTNIYIGSSQHQSSYQWRGSHLTHFSPSCLCYLSRVSDCFLRPSENSSKIRRILWGLQKTTTLMISKWTSSQTLRISIKKHWSHSWMRPKSEKSTRRFQRKASRSRNKKETSYMNTYSSVEMVQARLREPAELNLVLRGMCKSMKSLPLWTNRRLRPDNDCQP